MCGISGIINHGEIISGGSKDLLEKMANIQRHRGPDDSGVFWVDSIRSGLSHRRLSILDLSPTGHQPMQSTRRPLAIVFNGEIYNYLEIKRELESKGYYFRSTGDTEVVLAAFEEWGEASLNRFNGMFAFAILNTETGETFLARDHLGIKPLYYTLANNTLAFASEAKALFELPFVKKGINPNAVLSSLLQLWVPEPQSGYLNVFKLPAGYCAWFRFGKLDVKEYWSIPIIPEGDRPQRSESDLIDELRFLLEKSVRGQLISDVPVGAFLSGGLDSSLVVALMRKINPSQKLSTYTIGFTAKDQALENMPDDSKYAAKVATHFATDHHEIIIEPNINELLPKILWHLDDPICDGAAINTYLISKAAKELGTTVLLNGMGADELFGGYRRQLATLILSRYQHVPKFIRKLSIEPFIMKLPVELGGHGIRTIRWAQKFLKSAQSSPMQSFAYGFAYLQSHEFHKMVNDDYMPLNFEDLYAVQSYFNEAKKVASLPLIDQMTYLDTKLFLPGLNLNYSDKACMAASVEGRPPLIDKEIVEYASRIPSKLKINGEPIFGSTQKYILKKAAEAYLPKDIIYRPKASFSTPLRAWMKSGLDGSMRSTFSNPSDKVKQFFKPEYPLQLLDEHQNGSADHAHALWGALCVAKWLEI